MEPGIASHPRIHIAKQDLDVLKKRAGTTHAFYYGKLIEAADAISAQKLPERMTGGDDTRHFGDSLPVLAMACLLSGDRKYAGFCREILSRLVAAEKWGDNLDLVTGHFLSGAAIAYDWLYDYLTADEKKAISAKLAHHAQILYEHASNQRIWWHDFYLHNWNYVITDGLAYAAAALAGEDPRTGEWIDYCEGMFSEVERALPEDGSYQEGFAYMTYGWECLVRYFDLARQLYGRDHFGAKWLREAPYLLIYFSTPNPKFHDNCMMFGDGPRHFEWHGPVHLLYRSAGEYKDGVVQDFANKLVEAGVGVTRMGTWLNMLWYNPDVPAIPHEGLPTFKVFPNLDVASARSAWGSDAVMVGFKCTNNAGRKAMREYPGRDLGSGHAHPDAASFQIYAFGEWLAVDTGYTQLKETRDHNTIMVNGYQQLGGERMWFDVMECFMNGATAEITHAESTAEFDYLVGDATKIYRPQAKLAKFVRHVVYLKPFDVLVVDELEAKVESAFEWRMHADESIVAVGPDFEVRKNEARLRVSFLAPEMKAAVARSVIEGATSAGMKEAIVLSAAPKNPSVRTTLVTFLAAFRGAEPAVKASIASLSGSAVKLNLEAAGKSRILTLDLAERRVSIS